jgi:hypothetical protein
MICELLCPRTHALARVRAAHTDGSMRSWRLWNLALRWRADGNEPACTSITLMAAHPDLYW